MHWRIRICLNIHETARTKFNNTTANIIYNATYEQKRIPTNHSEYRIKRVYIKSALHSNKKRRLSTLCIQIGSRSPEET